MRTEDLRRLSEAYHTERAEDVDSRFYMAIGADIPHAGSLVNEIFCDLDSTSLGISWWSSLPTLDRALIGDYLYQCAYGIELNLAEAKLHHMELLDAREKQDKRIADVIYRDSHNNFRIKMPRSTAAIDDLPNKLEAMHLCGFFQAIGSSLDCLGASIIGILGLPSRLRRSSIGSAEDALSRVRDIGTAGAKVQLDFKVFYESVKSNIGVSDWLVWADQYRNMFVHRGRRFISNQLIPKQEGLVDGVGRWIPRATSTLHLAKYPDKSDAEAMIRKDAILNEDASVTLNGVFERCRDLEETLCERLLEIWNQRRTDPSLIEQPSTQWDANFKPCNFSGYEPGTENLSTDVLIGHPVMYKRMVAAGTDDAHRHIWTGTAWER